MLKKDKKGMGIVSNIVSGIAGLIILVIVSLLIVSTLDSAGLLTAGSAEDNAVGNLTANYTAGIDEIAQKIPTIMLIAAVVIIFGAIIILVRMSRATTQSSGGGGI